MTRKIFLTLPFLLIACGPEQPANRSEAAARSGEKLAGPSPPVRPHASAALTAEGWGPLRIGMTLAEVTGALGADADPEAVGGADPSSCDQFRPERGPRGMLVMIEQGRLSRISLIDDSPIETEEGVGLGDERDVVVAAYGTDAVATPHKYVDAPAAYLDVWAGGPKAGYVSSPAARGIRFEIDAANRVDAIHAGGPSIQYVEGCS